MYTLPSSYRFNKTWLNVIPKSAWTRSRMASRAGGKGWWTSISAPEYFMFIGPVEYAAIWRDWVMVRPYSFNVGWSVSELIAS